VFPLKLNPFNMACLLHAGFLYGEVSDSTEPLVSTVIKAWGRDSSQEQRDAAARLTDLVNRVWCENSGRALQQEAGLISQILGGCVYGVAFDPRMEAEGKLPIRIDHTMPDYFFPVPEPVRYWDLLEAFICFEISGLQAQRSPICYGVDEGSQRSGMTLVLRMLPLVVHIRRERTLHTAGLDQVARMILAIAAEKGAVRRVGTSRRLRGGIGRTLHTTNRVSRLKAGWDEAYLLPALMGQAAIALTPTAGHIAGMRKLW